MKYHFGLNLKWPPSGTFLLLPARQVTPSGVQYVLKRSGIQSTSRVFTLSVNRVLKHTYGALQRVLTD